MWSFWQHLSNKKQNKKGIIFSDDLCSYLSTQATGAWKRCFVLLYWRLCCSTAGWMHCFFSAAALAAQNRRRERKHCFSKIVARFVSLYILWKKATNRVWKLLALVLKWRWCVRDARGSWCSGRWIFVAVDCGYCGWLLLSHHILRVLQLPFRNFHA